MWLDPNQKNVCTPSTGPVLISHRTWAASGRGTALNSWGNPRRGDGWRFLLTAFPQRGQVLYFGDFGQCSSLSTTVLSFCLSHHLCSYTLWEHFLQIPLDLSSWRKRTRGKSLGWGTTCSPDSAVGLGVKTDQLLLPHPLKLNWSPPLILVISLVAWHRSSSWRSLNPWSPCPSQAKFTALVYLPSKLGTGIQKDTQMNGLDTKPSPVVQQCWITWGNTNSVG